MIQDLFLDTYLLKKLSIYHYFKNFENELNRNHKDQINIIAHHPF
jgi:hypothetical protein